MNLLTNTLRVWAMHRAFPAALAELDGRSDRELADLGVGRGDVARLAYAAAERRVATPAAGDSAPAPVWRDPAPVPGR